MNKLSLRRAFSIIFIIQITNSIILGITSWVGSSSAAGLIITLLGSIPTMLMYARLLHLAPGKTLFEMMDICFGKIVSSIVCVFYAFYFITLASIIRNYFTQFVHITTLINTPIILVLFGFFTISMYILHSEIETFGKWCLLFSGLAVAIVFVFSLLSTRTAQYENLLPLIDREVPQVFMAGIRGVVLPIGETVIFLGFSNHLDRRANPYKLLLISLISSVVFMLVIYVQIISVLGTSFTELVTFPFYTAASVLNIGTIGARVESLIILTFLFLGVGKVAAGMLAGTNALAHVFRFPSSRPLLLAVGFLTVALSTFIFDSILDTFDFFLPYFYYALPFQYVIPFVLFVILEIRMRVKKIPLQSPWKDVDKSDIKAQSP